MSAINKEKGVHTKKRLDKSNISREQNQGFRALEQRIRIDERLKCVTTSGDRDRWFFDIFDNEADDVKPRILEPDDVNPHYLAEYGLAEVGDDTKDIEKALANSRGLAVKQKTMRVDENSREPGWKLGWNITSSDREKILDASRKLEKDIMLVPNRQRSLPLLISYDGHDGVASDFFPIFVGVKLGDIGQLTYVGASYIGKFADISGERFNAYSKCHEMFAGESKCPFDGELTETDTVKGKYFLKQSQEYVKFRCQIRFEKSMPIIICARNVYPTKEDFNSLKNKLRDLIMWCVGSVRNDFEERTTKHGVKRFNLSPWEVLQIKGWLIELGLTTDNICDTFQIQNWPNFPKQILDVLAGADLINPNQTLMGWNILKECVTKFLKPTQQIGCLVEKTCKKIYAENVSDLLANKEVSDDFERALKTIDKANVKRISGKPEEAEEMLDQAIIDRGLEDQEYKLVQLLVNFVRAQITRQEANRQNKAMDPPVKTGGWTQENLRADLEKLDKESKEHPLLNFKIRFQLTMCKLYEGKGSRQKEEQLKKLENLVAESNVGIEEARNQGGSLVEYHIFLHQQQIKGEIINFKLKDGKIGKQEALLAWRDMLESRREMLGPKHRHTEYAVKKYGELCIECGIDVDRATCILNCAKRGLKHDKGTWRSINSLKDRQDVTWKIENLLPLVAEAKKKKEEEIGKSKAQNKDKVKTIGKIKRKRSG